MIDKTAFDGNLDPVAYQRIGSLLGEARAKRDHFGQQPVYDVGLYFSSRTRDWLGREEAAKYFQSFQGAHQACAMEHLQCGVLLDENVTLDLVRKFPVVCLPNVGIISARETELLQKYVREGGKLIVTGQPGQFDSYGKPLQQSAVEDLIGARVLNQLDSVDNWISLERSVDSLEAAALSADLRADWPFLVKGPATVYRPTTAQSYGTLYKPHRTQRQLEAKMGTDWPMSPDSPVGPAVLIHRLGKGTVVTCAASPDYATASEHALVEDRVLFRNLFRALLPKRRVIIDAPANVEAVVTDDSVSRTLRVHLLAYNPTPRTTPLKNRPYILPGMIEDKPMYRVTLFSSEAIRSARVLSTKNSVKLVENTVEAIVEDVHEVLLLGY